MYTVQLTSKVNVPCVFPAGIPKPTRVNDFASTRGLCRTWAERARVRVCVRTRTCTCMRVRARARTYARAYAARADKLILVGAAS